MFGLTLPKLVQDGMFMDAMLYTSVAHNLSQGIGDFWFPQFSHNNMAGLSSFHEQPPLGFGMQAVFFKLLGDSMYVERLYTFLTMCLTALLIVLIWAEIYKEKVPIKKIGWLPLFLWITIPVCFWSYANNMLENTMGVFTLFSVWMLYKGLNGSGNAISCFLIAGLSIFLATLSKGFPGFFPWAVPFLFWAIINRKGRVKLIISSTIIVLVPAILYFILYYFPTSRESLSLYLFKRAFVRISEDPTVGNRFYIMYRLLSELVPQMVMVGIVLLVAHFKKIDGELKKYFRLSLFFIGIGLAASLPLMLTMVQKGFYFVPALPYFAIGFSIIIAPAVVSLTERVNLSGRRYKAALVAGVAIWAGVIVFTATRVGKIHRDGDTLNDVFNIGRVVPKQSVIRASNQAWNNWSLQCYLMRYYNISLDPENAYDYLLVEKNERPDSVYKMMDIPTKQYDLYQLKQVK
jgi:4-amino-4-deoxy-L-arabinose transferase-like glycosyltransferase